MSPIPSALKCPGGDTSAGLSEADDRVEETFNLAIERDPADRAKFLEQACGDDMELHARV